MVALFLSPFIMEISVFVSCVLTLIGFVGLDLVRAQPFSFGSRFGRRGFLGRQTDFYPYPSPGFHRSSFIRDPFIGGPGVGYPIDVPDVVPVSPIIGGGLVRGPDVVSDRSDRQNINLNIVNENNNVHDQAGSGRVTVTQGNSNCARPCPTGYCPNPFQQCMYDPQCPGNYGCRDGGFM